MIANLLLINIFLWQSIPCSIYISLCTTQTKQLETLLIPIVEKNCENSFSFLFGQCNCIFYKATDLHSCKTLSSSSQICTFFLILVLRCSPSDWRADSLWLLNSATNCMVHLVRACITGVRRQACSSSSLTERLFSSRGKTQAATMGFDGTALTNIP